MIPASQAAWAAPSGRAAVAETVPAAPGGLPVPDTDTPTLVEGLDEPVDAHVPASRAAIRHLAEHRARYGVERPARDLEVSSVVTDGDRETVRLDQRHQGVPVLGAQYVVRMERDGGRRTVTGASGTLFTGLSVDTNRETLPAATIVDRAVDQVAAELNSGFAPRDRSALAGRDGGLVVLPAGAGMLTREVVVTGTHPVTGGPVRHKVYADAGSGVLLTGWNDLRTTPTPTTGERPGEGRPTGNSGRQRGKPSTPPADGTPSVPRLPVIAGENAVGSGTTLQGDLVPLRLTRDPDGTYWMQDDATDPRVTTHDGDGVSIQMFDGSWTSWDMPGLADPGGWHEYLPVVSSPEAVQPAGNTDLGAVDAHRAAVATREFYAERLGRDGIDGQGSAIHVVNDVANWGNPVVGASWDPVHQIVRVGSGDAEYLPLSADVDVIAHEITHGVVQHTADLVYSGQPGALNEAFADYFGNAVDVELSGTSMDDPTAGLVGEDLCRTFEPAECAIRDLNDGMTTADFVSIPDDETMDNGGVHLNSTIVSGALWDVREALGGRLADRIVYRALSDYLTPLSRFADARAAVLAAAKDLGLRGHARRVITRAFDAHGVTPHWERTVLRPDTKVLVDDVNNGYNTWPARWRFHDVGGGWYAVPRASMTITEISPLAIWAGRVRGHGTPRQVSPDDGRAHVMPATDGRHVAWVAVGETYDLMIAPVRGGRPRVLFSTTDGITGVSIDDGVVAWSKPDPASAWAERVFHQRVYEPAAHMLEPGDPLGDEGKPDVRDGRIAFLRRDFSGGFGVRIHDVRTGETVSAGHDTEALGADGPVLTGSGVVWAANLLFPDSPFGWGEEFKTLRVARPDGTGSRAITSEDGDVRSRVWSYTASDDVITVQESAPGDAGAGGDIRETVPRLAQYAWDGRLLGPVSCNPGAQQYPAAVSGREVVWIDSTTGDSALVVGDGRKVDCSTHH